MKQLSKALQNANHIRLKNLPPLTTTKELKSILTQNGFRGIANVALLYKRFRPINEALVALNSPETLQKSLYILNKLDIYGVRVKAQPVIPQEGWDLLHTRRSRGHKGRKEAAERGIWVGDGPNAGIRGLNIERAVTIWGFPGKATVEAVEKYLGGYAVSRAGEGEEAMIYKFPLPSGAYSLYSRFVVVLDSGEESRRIVEELHMSRLPGKPHIIYAQAIY